MKGVGLFLLAVVLVVSVAGCGGGGGDDPYNFNGVWIYSERITAQRGSCTWNSIVDRITISQNGIDVTLTTPSYEYSPKGTCSPSGTISWDYTNNYPLYATWTGTALDENTIQGTSRRKGGPCTVDTVWTMELAARVEGLPL